MSNSFFYTLMNMPLSFPKAIVYVAMVISTIAEGHCKMLVQSKEWRSEERQQVPAVVVVVDPNRAFLSFLRRTE
jgi:hypothetical protein